MPHRRNPEDSMLQHLIRISQALAGQLDFRSAIQAVADEVSDIIPYDHLDVCIVRPDGETHAAYETGLTTRWGSADEPPMPMDRSPIRDLLWGAVPYILTDDATGDARFLFEGAFNRPIFDAGLRSRLHVPLRVQGAVIGALSCSSHARARYTLDDVKAAQHVADLLAPYFYALRASEQAKQSAIEEAEARAREDGLRLAAFRLTEAQERERQRIGMDLHDETLAHLTRLLHRVSRLAEADVVDGEALRPVAESLNACIAELRRIIDDAKPNVLQLFGFTHGIEDLLDRARQEAGPGLATRLVDDTGGRINALDEPVRLALFRIVQEALNNAARHANAGEIVVHLKAEPHRIVIAVTDDGVGLSGGHSRKTGGIHNMRTRAALVAAEFRIGRPSTGRGTRVSIALPVPRPAEAAVAEAVAP